MRRPSKGWRLNLSHEQNSSVVDHLLPGLIVASICLKPGRSKVVPLAISEKTPAILS
jgi:hypothetical protein